MSADKLTAWRSRIGYVSQQLFMIEGSLLDNIVMGLDNNNPDMERIDRVLRLASLDRFVRTLPEGIHTSGSEKEEVYCREASVNVWV